MNLSSLPLWQRQLIHGTCSGIWYNIEVLVYSTSGCAPIAEANTNPTGLYTVSPALPADEYRVEFRPRLSGSSSAYLPATYAELIEISQPQVVDDVDVTLALGAVVYGRVVASDSGLPLEDVDVQTQVSEFEWTSGSSTNAAGLYASVGLSDGDKTLRLNAYSGGSVLSSFYAPKTATGLAVSASERVEHNDVLPRGGRISGYVSAQGEDIPLENVRVSLYNVEGEAWVDSERTAENGRYAFSGLADGEYKIQFETDADERSAGYVWAYYGGDITFESGSALTVQSVNHIEDINDDLARGGQIAGTIRDENNQPLHRASVSVYDLAGNLVGRGSTDEAGRYVTNGVAAGAKVVSFTRSLISDQCETDPMSFFYDNQADFGNATQVMVESGAVTSGFDARMDPSAPPIPIPATATPISTATPLPDATATPDSASTPDVTSTPLSTQQGNSSYLPLINR